MEDIKSESMENTNTEETVVGGTNAREAEVVSGTNVEEAEIVSDSSDAAEAADGERAGNTADADETGNTGEVIDAVEPDDLGGAAFDDAAGAAEAKGFGDASGTGSMDSVYKNYDDSVFRQPDEPAYQQAYQQPFQAQSQSSAQQQRTFENSVNGQYNQKRSGGGVKTFFAALAGVLVGVILTVSTFALLTGSGFSLFSGNGFAQPQKIQVANNNPQEVVAIAEKAGGSVVGVAVSGSTQDIFFGTQKIEGSGSGVIVRKDGYILTNYHVIEPVLDSNGKQRAKSSVEVEIPNVDKPLEATIVGHDSRTDLAVLKVNSNNLPEIEWADSSQLKVGELAVAIGNPGGIELAGSVTEGVVSGLNRKIPSESGSSSDAMPLIQTSAAINPGNSGGALVNNEGKLIGINSSKITGNGFEGIGFAIPSNQAKSIMESLIQYKMVKGRPWFGVQINSKYTADVAKANGYPEGLLVADVMPFSGASKAGIKIDDILTSFDGVPTKTYDEFETEKNKHKPGDVVKIQLYRTSEPDESKRVITVNVTLSEENSSNN